MDTLQNIREEVEAVLSRMGTLVSRHDLAVLGEFSDDGLVVGSEHGEIAEGSENLKEFFKKIFARPMRISWEWTDIRASSTEDLIWFFADGDIVVTKKDSEKRAPYRLAGVLQWRSNRWVWRQFIGSEPA